MNERVIRNGHIPMNTLTQTTDEQGRLVPPASFANSTVHVKEISDTELRIRRKSSDSANSEAAFWEDRPAHCPTATANCF